jgi:hypothetical protein
MRINVKSIIINTAQSAIFRQDALGFFDSGHNGPWNQEETPIRVTAHYAILLAKAYEITKEEKFKTSSMKAVDAILSSKYRHKNDGFICFKNKKKDPYNALIGQSWVLEALYLVGDLLHLEKYILEAHRIIKLHTYHKKLHLWLTFDRNHQMKRLQMTLNQQLFFNSVVMLISKKIKDQQLLEATFDFINHLEQHIMEYDDGLIHHHLKPRVFNTSKTIIKKLFMPQYHTKYLEFVRMLSEGYVSFVMQSMVILSIDKELLKKTIKSKHTLIKKLLGFVKVFPYYESNNNDYLYQYNPYGFEVSSFLSFFDENQGKLIKHLLELQIIKHYDFKLHRMSLNTKDSNTLSARIYELIYFRDLDLEIDI